MPDFNENLREEISFHNLTVKELAIKTGIPKPTLDHYLGRGKRKSLPSADIAVKLAIALNVSVEYLVTGEETKYSPKKEYFYDKYSRFEKEACHLILFKRLYLK